MTTVFTLFIHGRWKTPPAPDLIEKSLKILLVGQARDEQLSVVYNQHAHDPEGFTLREFRAGQHDEPIEDLR